ncbi:MAG: hypothetical protein AAGF87_05885 [Bacteroidota bacterium]
MDFKRSAVIVLGIIAGIAGYYFGAYLSGNGDDDQDTEDLVEITINNTKDALLGPLFTVDEGSLFTGEASTRLISEADRKANPCFWCMKVENQSATDPLYDCSLPCPCANAPVKLESPAGFPDQSIFTRQAIPNDSPNDDDEGGSVAHRGGVIIDSYFGLYDGSGIGQNGTNLCLEKDVDNKETVVELFYVAEVDCDIINKDSLDFLSLSYKVNGVGTSNFVDSIDLKNVVVQSDLCCQRDSTCTVSTVFSLELGNDFFSDLSNSITFELEIVHPNLHEDGDVLHQHVNNQVGLPTTVNYFPVGVDEHKAIYSFPISVCPQ